MSYSPLYKGVIDKTASSYLCEYDALTSFSALSGAKENTPIARKCLPSRQRARSSTRLTRPVMIM